MSIEGVSGPTKRVGRNNLEVRTDGFGTMTDAHVAQYKADRPRRYRTFEMEKRIEEFEARLVAIEGARS